MQTHAPYAQWLGSTVGTYRLEELLSESELGPLFAARDESSGAAFLVRLLAVTPAETNAQLDGYMGEVQRFATKVGTLQHPYILPVVDCGLHQGVPYLVWPHLVMRSLASRVRQSGPMDVLTVGRYLDQIAAALESAHQQATLHRNLSTENVYIQLDGHLVVADFGVRRLMELLGGGLALPYYGSVEACAPEQLTNGKADTSTDVYALGGVLYCLLTGSPVFAAESVEALLQHHLYAEPAPPSSVRKGLPTGLDGVLAAALAKEQGRRIRHPGEFANAYHQIVAPNSMTRVPFTAGPYAGGTSQVAPGSYAPPSGPMAPAAGSGESAAVRAGGREQSSRADTFAIGDRRGGPPGAERPRGARRLLRDGVFLAVVAVLVLASSGVFFLLRTQGVGGGVQSGGNVEFIDSAHGPPGHTDALRIVLRGVAAPPSGSQYDAWFVDPTNEQVELIGTLKSQGQSYVLTDDGNGTSGQAGTNLLAAGANFEVTLEQGDVRVPVGKVVMRAAFPPKALIHIQHLLVSFPTTPGKIGLLVGTLRQTQELDAQATVLQNAAASGNTVVVQCSAQSIVDIIEGTHGAHYHPLGADCAAVNVTLAGDGYGLLEPPAVNGQQAYTDAGGYLDGASDHASLAATAPDATAGIRLHAGHVEVAISNIKGWVTTADRDALRLLANPGDGAAITELVTMCDHAYHGVPSNPEQTINPVPGQAGAVTAYEHGQFMATLSLVPPQ